MSRRRSTPRRTRAVPWDRLHPTLDLHGDTADEARRRTERWLEEQALSGVRTVRVITGKGLHSVGPPVLPREIEALLRALKGKRVRDFTVEPGGGVYRVELSRPTGSGRRPSPRPTPAPAARVAADPEVRRQAEEALWELGVDPTPELIEIEVRRLLGRGRGG